MTYAATRSSVLERAKRKENGERSTLANRCIARLYPWRREAEIDGGPLLREGCSRGRRRRRRGDDRHLDRAEAGGALGRRQGCQSREPPQRRAAPGRLPL